MNTIDALFIDMSVPIGIDVADISFTSRHQCLPIGLAAPCGNSKTTGIVYGMSETGRVPHDLFWYAAVIHTGSAHAMHLDDGHFFAKQGSLLDDGQAAAAPSDSDKIVMLPVHVRIPLHYCRAGNTSRDASPPCGSYFKNGGPGMGRQTTPGEGSGGFRLV